MLEVRELGDLRLDLVAEQVLQFSRKRGKHFIPLANLLGQCANVTVLPEVAFVADFFEDAQ